MNPLSTWLRDSGLAQYLPLFEQHSIDLRSLPLLTDADLAELGVPLGHRRLLLKAVAELGRAVPATESLSAAQGDRTPRDAGRRQLTVLFCDLVGSTALAQRLDPEALRDLMRGYQQACGAVIERYAGHVAQYLGDGLVVYFGWPQAHEDDAERAVRAALEIIAAVHRVAGPESLQVRIGIATGAVVVGETSAGDASVPSAAVGETPNLAARLQGLAGPDQIVIASATHRLLGDSFEVEDLGDHSLKGIDGPVRARRIRGVARTESRFDASHAGRYTPFLGREQEVALLLARWEQAREGEGQVVLLVGEPGIGKSRITQVLRERLAATPHTRLGYQCSPYHSGSAFYPIVEQLERAAGFERDDGPERKLDKLEAVLVLSADERPSVTPLFAALLSLPIDRYPPRMLSPQKHKELTIAALVDQPIWLAGQQPVLMICEDAHWIDPSTLETLALAVERFRQAAILLLITCRPEFVPPWTGHGNVTLLNLNRLSRHNGAQMIQRLTGGKPLPAEVLAQILDRTDGVPLFVEELTKHMLEAGLLRDTGKRYELSGPLPTLAIPSTLQDSLMARLDRLAPVKEVAQIGACIGREFSHELLAAAALLPEEELNTALDKLVASELVFRQGFGPEATYSFKHALVQDAAYESLLKSRRQQIHERIAQALEKDFPDAVKARKRDPRSNLRSAQNNWDFWTLLPEALHQVTIVMSERGLPDGYRFMHGFGSHTFSLVNARGQRHWVKFHFRSQQGIRCLGDEQAEAIIAKDRESAQRDLFDAIAAADFPRWTLAIQVMTEGQADACPFNPFDLTKVWPHRDHPLIEVGVLELNRNPRNYFAEVEQAAFSPANLVSGIGFSPDKMLQARLFSYGDAQRYRLGVNFNQIPVNAPKCPIHSYHRDGAMRVDDNAGGTIGYAPNSLGEWADSPKIKDPPLRLEGTATHWDHRTTFRSPHRQAARRIPHRFHSRSQAATRR